MLSELQRLLMQALRDEDPAAFLRARAVDPDVALDERERAWLTAVDADGLRMTRVLVRKLRIERLVRGDAELAARFGDDPASFAARFRAYDAAVAPRAVTPAAEARAFARFERAGEHGRAPGGVEP